MIRNILSQKEGLDFNEVINNRKILLVKLSQGLIGEENSYLLGTLILSKIYQVAQARQSLPKDDRHPFYIYLDEFQNFITPSINQILSGARKYGTGLVLAHQELNQIKDTDIGNSVLSNANIRICFRLGDFDAKKLESGFSGFDSNDLQNLNIGEAIARVGKNTDDFSLKTLLHKDLSENENRSIIVSNTREKYSKRISEIEENLDTLLSDIKEQKPVVKEDISEPKVELPKSDIQEKGQEYLETIKEKEEIREHRYLQTFIKKIAEERGFKATIEETINNGRVDVSLVKDDLKIACEISVTNRVEYEVQNIQKCFTAGYTLVFMISNDLAHLNGIRTLAVSEISQVFHNRLYFVSKDDFVNQLDLLLARQSQPTEIRAKGYRVKLNYTGSSDASSQQKVLKDVILSSMRRKDKGEEPPGVKHQTE